MQVLSGGKQWPAPLVFSPDGRYLAADTESVFNGARIFRVWDRNAGGEPVWAAPAGYGSLLAFGPESRHLVVTQRHLAGRLDWQNGPHGRFYPDKHLTEHFPHAVTPDGRLALAETHVPYHEEGPDWVSGQLTLRATRNNHGVWSDAWERELWYTPHDEHDPGYLHLLFSTSGRFVVWVRMIGRTADPMPQTEISLFDADTGHHLVRHPTRGDWRGDLPKLPGKAAAGPTGLTAIIKGRSLYVADPLGPNDGVVKRTNATAKHFTDLAFSPHGTRLATVSRDTAVTLWDATTWEVIRQHEWKIGPLRSVAFAPDGLRCAAGSETGQVVVWDIDE